MFILLSLTATTLIVFVLLLCVGKEKNEETPAQDENLDSTNADLEMQTKPSISINESFAEDDNLDTKAIDRKSVDDEIDKDSFFSSDDDEEEDRRITVHIRDKSQLSGRENDEDLRRSMRTLSMSLGQTPSSAKRTSRMVERSQTFETSFMETKPINQTSSESESNDVVDPFLTPTTTQSQHIDPFAVSATETSFATEVGKMVDDALAQDWSIVDTPKASFSRELSSENDVFKPSALNKEFSLTIDDEDPFFVPSTSESENHNPVQDDNETPQSPSPEGHESPETAETTKSRWNVTTAEYNPDNLDPKAASYPLFITADTHRDHDDHEDATIQLKRFLRRDKIKLWLKPYSTRDGNGHIPEDLIRNYQQETGFNYFTIQHSLERLRVESYNRKVKSIRDGLGNLKNHESNS